MLGLLESSNFPVSWYNKIEKCEKSLNRPSRLSLTDKKVSGALSNWGAEILLKGKFQLLRRLYNIYVVVSFSVGESKKIP